MFQPHTQFMEVYRASMRSAADMTKASLEHTERLQNRQLEMLRRAIDESSRSASELANARSLDELMQLQTRLANAQMERMLDFWGALWRSAGETTESMARQAASQVQHQAREAQAQVHQQGGGERHRKAA